MILRQLPASAAKAEVVVRPLSSRAKAILIGLAVVIGLFIFVDWLAEYLWFEALAYESVFWRIRLLKAGLFLAALISVFLYFWVNFRIFAAFLDIRSLVSTLITHAGFHPATADPIKSNFEQKAGNQNLGKRMPGALLLLPSPLHSRLASSISPSGTLCFYTGGPSLMARRILFMVATLDSIFSNFPFTNSFKTV